MAWTTAVVALAGSAFFIACVSRLVLPYALTHDYIAFYTAAKAVQEDHTRLYDLEYQTRIQTAAAPDLPVVVPYVRPGFASFLYIPLAWMSLETGFALWLGLGALALIATWVWAARSYGPEILVYCAFFVPPIYGIIHGQDSAFILGLTLLAYLSMKRGARILCGILLALLLVKFHLFFLVPVTLLVRRERRILAGYIPTACALVAISLAVASPQSYIALLTNKTAAALNPSPQMMLNAMSVAVNFGLGYPVVNLVLITGALAVLFRIPKEACWERWFWGAILGGIIVTPHAYEYDAAVLLVPLVLILADATASPARRIIAAVAVSPPPYLLTLLPKPFSAGPAILMILTFLMITWPGWFAQNPLAALRPRRAQQA